MRLTKSLLIFLCKWFNPCLDPTKASEADLKEAFCRDIDTFSWELAQPQVRQDQVDKQLQVLRFNQFKFYDHNLIFSKTYLFNTI